MLFPLAGRPDKPFHSEPLFNDSGAVGSLLLGTRCSPGNTKALSVQNRIHITRKIMKPNAFHTAAGIFQRLHTGIRSQNVVFVPSAVNWWTINDKASGRLVIVGVSTHARTHTHTHTFNSHFSGNTQVNQYQKGKTNLDFTEARDSEWQWAIC